jgi:hypothetical protein
MGWALAWWMDGWFRLRLICYATPGCAMLGWNFALCRILGLGFGVWGLGCRVESKGERDQGCARRGMNE